MYISNMLHLRVLLYMTDLAFSSSTQVTVTVKAMDEMVNRTPRALALANVNLMT